jgi:hypothetical protein
MDDPTSHLPHHQDAKVLNPVQTSDNPFAIEVLVTGLPGSEGAPALYLADLRGFAGQDLGEWFVRRFSELRRTALGVAVEFPGAVKGDFPPRSLFSNYQTNPQNVGLRANALAAYYNAVFDAVKARRLPLAAIERVVALPRPAHELLSRIIAEREQQQAVLDRMAREASAQRAEAAEREACRRAAAMAEAEAFAAAQRAEIAALEARRAVILRAAETRQRTDLQPVSEKAMRLLDQGVLL